MNQSILALKEQLDAALQSVSSVAELESLKVEYLGKKGSITALLKNMGKLAPEEKKSFGAQVNALKDAAAQAIADKVSKLEQLALQRELEAVEEFDVSLPPVLDRGSYHPVTLVQRKCEEVFRTMGFTVEDYSEIVTDYECFESLNIPPYHPARDMQDTFYLTEDLLLRTQTSNGQIRTMDRVKPPIKVLIPGRVFRSDSDATHSPMFHQIGRAHV